MKSPKSIFPHLVALGALSVCACSSDSTNNPSNNSNPSIHGDAVGSNSEVSECGGFKGKSRDSDGYCDAERLLWTFDSETKTLSIANTRVLLNCCGKHSIDAFYDSESGTYTVVEIDAPADGGARCACMCVFDYKTDITGVDSESAYMVISRHVTDEGEPRIVWTGTLDIADGEGTEVVYESPPDWCSEENI